MVENIVNVLLVLLFVLVAIIVVLLVLAWAVLGSSGLLELITSVA